MSSKSESTKKSRSRSKGRTPRDQAESPRSVSGERKYADSIPVMATPANVEVEEAKSDEERTSGPPLDQQETAPTSTLPIDDGDPLEDLDATDATLVRLEAERQRISALIDMKNELRRALVDMKQDPARAARQLQVIKGDLAPQAHPVEEANTLAAPGSTGQEPDVVPAAPRGRINSGKPANPCELSQPELLFEHHRVPEQDCPKCFWPVRKHQKDPQLATKLSEEAPNRSLRARTPERSHNYSDSVRRGLAAQNMCAFSLTKRTPGRPKGSATAAAKAIDTSIPALSEDEKEERELWEIYQRHKAASKPPKPHVKTIPLRVVPTVVIDPDPTDSETELEPSSSSSSSDDVTFIRRTKPPPKGSAAHYIPKSTEVKACVESVPMWDEATTNAVSAKRYVTLMASAFRKVVGARDPDWKTRTWPTQHLGDRITSIYIKEWIDGALVDNDIPWTIASERFLERYRTPDEEFRLETEWKNLSQKKLPLHEFKDKFLHLIAQRGYTRDACSPDQDKMYAEQFTQKIDPDLYKAWVAHPTYGPLSEGYIKSLDKVMRNVSLVHNMLAITDPKAKGSVLAASGSEPSDTHKRTFHCKNHGSNPTHNTNDCRLGRSERKVSFRAGDTAVTKGILKPSSSSSSQGTTKPTDRGKSSGSTPAPASNPSPASANVAKCSHCDKPGHTQDRCYSLHPELRPPKANAVRVAASLTTLAGEEPMDHISHHPTLLMLEEGLGILEAEREIEYERYPFNSIPAPKDMQDNGLSARRVTAPTILDSMSSESRTPRILIGLPNFAQSKDPVSTASPDLAPTTLKEALSDSGCSRTAIDAALARALQLPVNKAADGMISLANSAVSIPRIGATQPLDIVIYFVTTPGEARIEPLAIKWSFEVMENIHREGEYSILFGQDLLDHCWNLLKERGVSAESYLPFTIGKALASTSRARGGPVDVSTNLTMAAAQPVLDQKTEPELSFDLARDLEPVERFELERDDEDSEEWTQKTQELLQDPVVTSAIQRNANIPKTSFCSDPEAVLRLDLKPGIDPASLFVRQYPMAQVKMKYVDEQIDKWAQEGRIESAPLGCVVNNPLLCVPKMEGGRAVPGKYRVCIDPRRINAALATNDKFPISHIGRNHQFLAGRELFGEIDIENCFLQFELAPECRYLTAFTWKGKQWQFVGAPFGIKYFPNWIHRFISSRIADPLEFTCTFVDNAAFGANNWDEHKSQLIQLLNRCSDLNLRVKIPSIKVGFTRIRVLGHIVSKSGLFLDPRKLSVIKDWPKPTNGKEVQSFLGTVGFIRQYIRHYADLSAPLEAVKNIKGTIQWTERMERHFEQLKSAVAHPPFLCFPDFSRPFYIGTDASQLGVGGVLYQPKDGEEDIRPENIVAIVSKVLSGAQLNYSAFKRELMALVFCLRQFHQYIWGRTDTVIYTDHKPLTYMFTVPNPSVTLQAYMDVILEHCLEVRYRPGVANVLPDCLSRVYARRYDVEKAPWGIPSNIKFNILPEELDKGEESLETKTTPKPKPKSPKPKPKSPTSDPISLRQTRMETEEKNHQSPLEEMEQELTPKDRVELLRRGKAAPSTQNRIQMIQEEHAFGHFGRDQIFRRLWDKGFWWPEMRKEIQLEIMKCDACSRFVVHKEGFKPAEFITADGPWHHIQIDCQTHLPRSPEGYTTLLSIVDVFSGFCLLFPLVAHTAQAVAQKLWYTFSLFGFPQIIQSDNGTEFTGKVVKELLALTHIDHRFISAYNPRCDGKVERNFGLVNEIAKKLLQGANHLWPLFIEAVQCHINSHISSLTKSTPFALMFGRDAQLPTSYPRLPQDVPYSGRTVAEWLEYQKKIVEVIRPSISKLILDTKVRAAGKLDTTRRLLPRNAFPPDAEVMIKDPAFLSKHSRIGKRDAPYIGPYAVVRRDRNGNYVLKDTDGTLVNRHVPPDQMKPGPSEPSDNADIQTVELVINHRGEPGSFEYLTKWKDLPLAESTWVPAHDFIDTQCIRDYWTRVDTIASQDR
jgi:hypothetical protein